jgi:hypothetical protein
MKGRIEIAGRLAGEGLRNLLGLSVVSTSHAAGAGETAGMGSSAKKKAEKKKDFKKEKLKVGKQKPKPTNLTDTSFRAKGKPPVAQSQYIKY